MQEIIYKYKMFNYGKYITLSLITYSTMRIKYVFSKRLRECYFFIGKKWRKWKKNKLFQIYTIYEFLTLENF